MSNAGEKAYLNKILKALLDNENIPVSRLADLLGVSVKKLPEPGWTRWMNGCSKRNWGI
ncbi:hypothetical protein [Lacrimispora xylanisolvens]|uniref:hypothetical protein n=1 Tax=Lacrimispora xylanisolvens TaxID=384636 RepID=UPI002402D154